MLIILYILTGIALLAVIGTLVMGAASMKGKTIEDRDRSNKWMARRVTAQAIAIVLIMITVYLRSRAG